jgi:hypothetical protein
MWSDHKRIEERSLQLHKEIARSRSFEEAALGKVDGFVKSPIFMSFRAKREILWEQAIEKIGFLPTVEMTNADFSTFYEFIKVESMSQGT